MTISLRALIYRSIASRVKRVSWIWAPYIVFEFELVIEPPVVPGTTAPPPIRGKSAPCCDSGLGGDWAKPGKPYWCGIFALVGQWDSVSINRRTTATNEIKIEMKIWKNTRESEWFASSSLTILCKAVWLCNCHSVHHLMRSTDISLVFSSIITLFCLHFACQLQVFVFGVGSNVVELSKQTIIISIAIFRWMNLYYWQHSCLECSNRHSSSLSV